MMRHFHGADRSHQDAVIKKRMQYHAQLDAEREEVRRQIRVAAQLRRNAAKVITVSRNIIRNITIYLDIILVTIRTKNYLLISLYDYKSVLFNIIIIMLLFRIGIRTKNLG